MQADNEVVTWEEQFRCSNIAQYLNLPLRVRLLMPRSTHPNELSTIREKGMSNLMAYGEVLPLMLCNTPV